ncbi:MAG TPA: hypothetical protein EYP43_01140 [Thermoplasmata archaeon]|nr:hypothetical protein [Thermoplasmata archaeon]
MKLDDYIKRYKKPISILGAITIITSVYIVFWAEAANADYWEGENGNSGHPSDELVTYNESYDAHLNEGDSHAYEVSPPGVVKTCRVTLTWTDEDDETLMENDGDTFTLTVNPPNAESKSEQKKNEHGQSGEIVIDYDFALGDEQEGAWIINVTLDEAGDQWPIFIGPSIGLNDPANDYHLEIVMEYFPME